MNDLYASAAATLIAEVATLPICTTKTCYQTSNSSSITQVIRQIYKENGIYGFYRASIPAITSQMISTSSKYVLYRQFDKKMNRVSAGIFSGIISSLVTHPMDYFRIAMQTSNKWTTNVSNDFNTIGPRVLYRGYSKSFSKVVVGSALFFPLTDFFRDTFNSIILSSFMSSIISTTIMHPIDYLKTRHIKGLPLYNGLNPLPYYKGLSLNLMRIVPHFTITMSLIDYFSKLF
jgi:hypothetical protein